MYNVRLKSSMWDQRCLTIKQQALSPKSNLFPNVAAIIKYFQKVLQGVLIVYSGPMQVSQLPTKQNTYTKKSSNLLNLSHCI